MLGYIVWGVALLLLWLIMAGRFLIFFLIFYVVRPLVCLFPLFLAIGGVARPAAKDDIHPVKETPRNRIDVFTARAAL